MTDFDKAPTATPRNVVLVTGASGFLGQHVVRLLQENDENVDEIRCFDLVEYANHLKHREAKPMRKIVGDICKEEQVADAVKGARWIINCAAVSDLHDSKLCQAVNVDGVNVLLNAAVQHSVPYFIQVSTADVCCGSDSNYYAAENTSSIPRKHILTNYSRSKYEAELIVGKASGRLLGNGYDRMRTIILRPTILYGEQDRHYVPMALRWAKDFRGTLIKIDNIYTRLQWCYAGNAAWACIRAKEAIVTDESLSAEEFFVTDDTPIVDPYDFLKPFVEARRCKVSKRSIPYLLVQLWLLIIILLIKLVRPIYRLRLPARYDPYQIQYFCTTHFFNRNKATLRLDYKPLFDAEKSQQLSCEYYRELKV